MTFSRWIRSQKQRKSQAWRRAAGGVGAGALLTMLAFSGTLGLPTDTRLVHLGRHITHLRLLDLMARRARGM
jgi:hypothetical protein